jgi:hypothetical protein
MIRWRVCSLPGCPTQFQDRTKSGRCPAHRTEFEQQRGSSTARGYGQEHRTAGNAAIEGATHCTNCGQPFTANNPAQRGHKIAIRNGGTAADGYEPHCRACNLAWQRTGL